MRQNFTAMEFFMSIETSHSPPCGVFAPLRAISVLVMRNTRILRCATTRQIGTSVLIRNIDESTKKFDTRKTAGSCLLSTIRAHGDLILALDYIPSGYWSDVEVKMYLQTQ